MRLREWKWDYLSIVRLRNERDRFQNHPVSHPHIEIPLKSWHDPAQTSFLNVSNYSWRPRLQCHSKYEARTQLSGPSYFSTFGSHSYYWQTVLSGSPQTVIISSGFVSQLQVRWAGESLRAVHCNFFFWGRNHRDAKLCPPLQSKQTRVMVGLGP